MLLYLWWIKDCDRDQSKFTTCIQEVNIINYDCYNFTGKLRESNLTEVYNFVQKIKRKQIRGRAEPLTPVIFFNLTPRNVWKVCSLKFKI